MCDCKQNTNSRNLTTEAHFELFKAECRRWIKEFGLLGYRVSFTHEQWSDDDLATISVNHLGRFATINLSPNWQECEVSEDQLGRTAFHEVCELLLLRFQYLGEAREVRFAEFEEERHHIIRTLENVIWEKDNSSRPVPILPRKDMDSFFDQIRKIKQERAEFHAKDVNDLTPSA